MPSPRSIFATPRKRAPRPVTTPSPIALLEDQLVHVEDYYAELGALPPASGQHLPAA